MSALSSLVRVSVVCFIRNQTCLLDYLIHLPRFGSASLGDKELLSGLKGTVGFTLVTMLSTPLLVASEGVTLIVGLGDVTLGFAGKVNGEIFGNTILVEDCSSIFGRAGFVVETGVASCCIRVLERTSDMRVGGGLVGRSGGSLSGTSKYSSSSSSDLICGLKYN